MYSFDRLVPKRSDSEKWNEPPRSPASFSRSNSRSRPRLWAPVKPCSLPPVGLPRVSVTNVTVGVMPWSSSQGRRPYQSPNRCALGRVSWKGVGARERVPGGAGTASWARATAAQSRSTSMATRLHIREIVRFCTGMPCCCFPAIIAAPFQPWRHCTPSFPATGEILPRRHWRCRPRGTLEGALSVS